MLEIFLIVIHMLVALFMILVVLVQGGNSGGVGAAFGGGNSSGFFGASGATSFLGKLTYFAAGIFMVTSISLAIVQGRTGKINLDDRIEQKLRDQIPQATPSASSAPVGTSAPAESPAAIPAP